MQAQLERLTPAILGFVLVVNLYVLPHAGTSPRLTDLLSLLLTLWLLVRVQRRGLPPIALAVTGIVALLPLSWCLFAYLEHDTGTLVLAMRWLLSLPWALALLVIVRDEPSRVGFAYGLLVGCAVNALVVVMQFTGFDPLLRPLGISSTDSEMATWVMDQARLPGLHRHYGASSAVTSLIAPAALYLYLRGRHGLWLPLVALGALAATLQITLTRSPLLVTGATVALALLFARRQRQLLTLGGVLALLAIPALVVLGPPGGKARWTDELSFQANADERFGSTLTAIVLAAEHPFGLGIEKARTNMLQRGAISATHNAYVQTALFFGIPLALVLVVTSLRHALRVLRGADDADYLLALIALQTVGLFLFEEHLNNPTFLVLACWFAAAAARDFSPVNAKGGAVSTPPVPVR